MGTSLNAEQAKVSLHPVNVAVEFGYKFLQTPETSSLELYCMFNDMSGSVQWHELDSSAGTFHIRDIVCTLRFI